MLVRRWLFVAIDSPRTERKINKKERSLAEDVKNAEDNAEKFEYMPNSIWTTSETVYEEARIISVKVDRLIQEARIMTAKVI